MPPLYDIRSAVKPLRLIFWGALVWILDVNINGFDVVNDVLGAILVAVGVYRLARLEAGERYGRVMEWVWFVALASVPAVLIEQLVKGPPPWLSIPLTLLSLAQFAGIIAFCVAMRWLCLEYNLPRSAQSWWLTTILLLAMFVGPLGLLYLWMLIRQLTGARWNFGFGIGGVIAVMLVLLVPVVHFFISTSRMRREAWEGGRYEGHGFEVMPPPPETPP